MKLFSFGRSKPQIGVPSPLYLVPQGGSDKNDGASWNTGLATMAEALRRVRRAGTINVYGKLVEDGLITPQGITDVTIIGCGTRPREGNLGRAAGPKGGAADWRYRNDTSTSPLLHVTQQGWRFKNLMLRGSKNGGAILITRNLLAETSDKGFAGDHATFENCVFAGPSRYGICQEGGVMNVAITGCMFRGFSNPDSVAILGITGEGVGFPLIWDIHSNTFVGNHSDISCGCTNSTLTANIFQPASVLALELISPRVSVDFSLGRDNTVAFNQFGIPRSHSTTQLKPGAADVWGPNYFTDGELFGTGVYP